MDSSDLEECARSDSITKTCRLIVSKLVPKEERVGTSWKNIPFSKREAVLSKKNIYSDILYCLFSV
jgi:hypothetical protein